MEVNGQVPQVHHIPRGSHARHLPYYDGVESSRRSQDDALSLSGENQQPEYERILSSSRILALVREDDNLSLTEEVRPPGRETVV